MKIRAKGGVENSLLIVYRSFVGVTGTVQNSKIAKGKPTNAGQLNFPCDFGETNDVVAAQTGSGRTHKGEERR